MVERLGAELHYVCTINEANMGLQMAAMIARMMKQAGGNLQVGMDPTKNSGMAAAMAEMAEAFGVADPRQVHIFLSPKSSEGDRVIIEAHKAARAVLKEKCPHLKVGLTLSLHDIQVLPGGEEQAAKLWEDELLHYLPALREDDFLGVQNYTREIVGPDGIQKAPEGNPLTQMNYEDYPEALGHVLRAVAKDLSIPLMVTENGIATDDDQRRIQFIDTALAGVTACMANGIDVKGYLHWSLLDNYEWAKAYSVRFGLVAVDHSTMERIPKPSLKHLGSWR